MAIEHQDGPSLNSLYDSLSKAEFPERSGVWWIQDSLMALKSILMPSGGEEILELGEQNRCPQDVNDLAKLLAKKAVATIQELRRTSDQIFSILALYTTKYK
jgi:hypothetical protein